MTDASNPPVDSPEGIAILMRWAKASRLVLGDYHRRIAERHGVSTDGVIFSSPLPLS